MNLSPFFVKQALAGGYRLPIFELAKHARLFIPLIPSRPIEASINVTDNCNVKCITCSMWRQKSVDELTTAEIHSILAQLKSLGISYLVLTGGEPLLRRDLSSIVRKAKELKFDRIQIITNASLLTRQRAEDLLESGVTTIHISLNGSKDAHDMTRGVKGSYERCFAALRSLVELRDSNYKHLEIKVVSIVMPTILGEIPHLLDICRDLKVELTLSPLDTHSYLFRSATQDMDGLDQEKLDEAIMQLHQVLRAHPEVISETHTSLEYVRRYFIDPRRGDIPCYLGYLAIYIGAHGEVYSGCNVLPPIGNLRDKPLRQIISSAAYKQRLGDMFIKKCPGCACGYRLNLYAHAPALMNEILGKLRIGLPAKRGQIASTGVALHTPQVIDRDS